LCWLTLAEAGRRLTRAADYILPGPPLARLAPDLVKKTVQKLLAEYGAVAVVVYFTIFFATLGGFWLAIRFGFRPSSAAGSAGTFAAAYVATKLTQPIRIAATIVVTPVIAKLYERVRGPRRATPND
jgi:hypothetical protein